MSQDVARRELSPVEKLAAEVRSADVRGQVEAALPEGLSPHRFVRATATALLEKPELVDLDRRSLFTAIIKSATDGLVPDNREAALVPFKGKVVYLPMVGGFRKIAAEHGWSLRARVVYSREPFDFEAGAAPSVYHKPIVSEADRGEMVLAYAIAKHRTTGAIELDVMTKDEIEKVRKTSASAGKADSPWKTWPERMWEKTVARRLFKQLPLDERDKARIDRVLTASDDVEDVVYGEPRQELPEARGVPSPVEPSGGTAAPSDAAAATEPVEAEGASAPGSEPLFEGEEPPAAAEAENRNEADERLALVLPDAFTAYAGKTIGEIAAAGDEGYLKWLATEVKDDAIREAAKQGLAELES